MAEKQRILIVDDDENIAELISLYLLKECYDTKIVYDGEEAIKVFADFDPQLVLLDLMLPGIDGYEVCKYIRQSSQVPIIMLSAKSEDADKILGLNIGADDYLTKPFNPLELVARVKSQLRRYKKLGNMSMPEPQKVVVGDLEIDDETKEVVVAGELIKLTPIEYNILLLLAKNAGKVYSIDEIYEQIWNEEAIGADNTVAVHIRHIREKIEINPKEPRYLKVVWGVGYKIEKHG